MDEIIPKDVAERIFKQGYLEGVKAHAVFKNGEELVGTMRIPFHKYADILIAGHDTYFQQIWNKYLWDSQDTLKVILI
jgi:hypothetical protein